MPRTKYHAKLEAERQARANQTNQNQETIMATNETNGNGQLTTANLNKLASALGENYQPETATIEDLLFGDKSLSPLLSELANLLGANESKLADILINDTLVGNGNKSRLLRLLLDEAKVKQLEQQQQLLQQQKQDLLDQIQTLDQRLNNLSGSYASLKSVIG